MSDQPGKKIVEHHPPPLPEESASPATERSRERSSADDELPPPSFRQALIGYGSIMLGLVLLGLFIGFLMKVLR